MRCFRTSAAAIGRPCLILLAPKKSKTRLFKAPRTAAPATTLASFHPGIARMWMTAASNKMLQPHHVAPDSRKLAWWCCPSCSHQFNKRIDLHVAAGGACPKCHACPSVVALPSSTRKSVEDLATAVKHRCRPDSSLGTLAAPNANRIKKSVADGQYLRVSETRNLMPMLAKNYEKESSKIVDDEKIFVSPKLDGIRCVVAYDVKNKRILFFSRSGTLFECCDEKIEPALRYAFEKDPALVLDGELYNDSVNKAKAASALASSSLQSCGAFLKALRKTDGSAQKGRKAATKENEVSFQELTSAIRTTREYRTPEAAALQNQLQYHIFDVLYSTKFAACGNKAPFSERYAHLTKLIGDVNAHNASAIRGYDPLVLTLVPCMRCTKAEVDTALRQAMSVGYEGVMIRRDSTHEHKTRSAQKRIKTGAALGGTDTSGAYGYGQRSSTLLKYKVMQDDEFVIVSAVEGKGKWKGRLGAFLCQTKNKKKTFTVTPASTDEQKKKMWARWKKEYVGKALTVQYQELTTDGIPRFPVGKCIRGAANGKDWI